MPTSRKVKHPHGSSRTFLCNFENPYDPFSKGNVIALLNPDNY